MKLLIYSFSILIVCVLFLVSGLFFWGIGNLVIWAFDINATFNFIQGLVVAIVFWLLSALFKK